MKFTPGRLAPVADFFWPRICTACDRAIEAPGVDHLCGACEEALEWIRGETCRRCGAEASGRCGECYGREFPFDRAVAVARYEGRIRKVLTHFKFYKRADLAYTLADYLAERLRREGLVEGLGAIVPIPSHTLSGFFRRYHAADVLAEELSRRIGVPLRKELLRKVKWRRPQVGLAREKRLANPRGAFASAPQAVVPASVLLVDDVMTTGATASEAAIALKSIGVQRVIVGVIGR